MYKALLSCSLVSEVLYEAIRCDSGLRQVGFKV
jgi:hypothetical protein